MRIGTKQSPCRSLIDQNSLYGGTNFVLQRYFAPYVLRTIMSSEGRTEVALDEDAVDRIRHVLSRHSVRFAMIFGSAARDTMVEGSDIDLAIEFEGIQPDDDGYSRVYLGLLSDLDDTVSSGIDVVDVHTMSPRFARAAFDSGVVILGSEERRGELENELAADSISVEEARERVATAVERLKEN